MKDKETEAEKLALDLGQLLQTLYPHLWALTPAHQRPALGQWAGQVGQARVNAPGATLNF